MNKTIIGVIVVVALAVVGFLFVGSGPGDEPVATAPAIEGAEEAADAAGEAAAAATETATEAAGAAADAVEETATEAAGAATDAVEETATAATETATAIVDEAKSALSEVLTVETFDFDKVVAAIEDSGLGDTQKATLTAALDSARQDPSQLEAILEQVRAALDI